MSNAIPGYTMGSPEVPRAPITLEELELLKQTVLFTEEDARYLRMSYDILKDQTDEILDVWYGFVGSKPHLLHFFTDPSTGKPNADYLAAVRKHFGQWILDTARAQYDQAWLDYQFEIGRRHHASRKNKTDNVHSVSQVNYRYLIPLIMPVTTTLKPFLAAKGHSREEVEKMHDAWMKSVLLQVTLWSYPYVGPNDY